jgi:hypothetical protein
MFTSEMESNVLAEYITLIDLLMPVITGPEDNTEPFSEDADYAQ